MKSHLLKLALVIVALSLNACATMFNTTRQKVSFSSNPSGAEVFINNKSTGKTTPCNIWVTRKVQRGETNSKNQYIYEFKKDGFVPYAYTDNAKVSGKIYLNLLLNIAAIPGFGIDFISGGAYTYNNDVLATMQKETGYVVIRDTVVKQQIVYVQSPENKGDRKSVV